jgi:phospholipase C
MPTHTSTDSSASPAAAPRPPIKHVFVINLENKGFKKTFGAGSPASYLSKTLRRKGVLLSQYYGTAHHSLPNYLAQVSGQGPNRQTQADCKVYSGFKGSRTVSPQQAVGQGCVYPKSVKTIANQLQSHGLTWRGYMEDMGRRCRHPRLNTADHTQKAQKGDQYAARHNPFVYFKAIAQSSCRSNDVDLGHLKRDLASVRTTRNLSYITPNLCNDAHDSPCADARRGGLVTADRWLRSWVPKILASPAFKKNGLLVVTFDEADGSSPHSAAACCGEKAGPNSRHPGITGPGGGRIGAVLVSPFIRAHSSDSHRYNHYSLLRTMEQIFGLPALGYAQQAHAFGNDVWRA